MAKTTKKKKKPARHKAWGSALRVNSPDATLRNVRAAKKRIDHLAETVLILANKVTELQESRSAWVQQTAKLEQLDRRVKDLETPAADN